LKFVPDSNTLTGFICKSNSWVHDFRLPPLHKWSCGSSGLLSCVGLYLFTEVSGQWSRNFSKQIQRCVTTQKSENLKYTVAEACNIVRPSIVFLFVLQRAIVFSASMIFSSPVHVLNRVHFPNQNLRRIIRVSSFWWFSACGDCKFV
jgi:hypothetical protein